MEIYMTKNRWRDEDDRNSNRSGRSSATRDYGRETAQQENDSVSYSDRSYSGQRRNRSQNESSIEQQGGYGRGRQENYGQGSYENNAQNPGQSYGNQSYGQSNYAQGGSYGQREAGYNQQPYGQSQYGQGSYGGQRGQYGEGSYAGQGQGGYSQSPYNQGRSGQGYAGYNSPYGQGFGYGSEQDPARQGSSEWSSYGRGGQNAGSGNYGKSANNYSTGNYSGGYSGGGRANYGTSYGDYGRDSNRDQNDRGFWNRAADEVSSWFGNEGAEQRRQVDKYHSRGPKNYTRSDDRIREDVCDRLAADPWIDASEVEVSVSGAEVTLSGEVHSRDQRRRIEDCAENVSGVSHVQNNTRVNREYSTSGYGASLGASSGAANSSIIGSSSKSTGSTKMATGTASGVNATTGSTPSSGRINS